MTDRRSRSMPRSSIYAETIRVKRTRTACILSIPESSTEQCEAGLSYPRPDAEKGVLVDHVLCRRKLMVSINAQRARLPSVATSPPGSHPALCTPDSSVHYSIGPISRSHLPHAHDIASRTLLRLALHNTHRSSAQAPAHAPSVVMAVAFAPALPASCSAGLPLEIGTL